jgi:hypothetical protein
MRKLALWLAFLFTLSLALPVLAQDDDEGYDADEEQEPSALGEYGSDVENRFLIGLNSLITFPADPVMSTVEPAEEFDDLPLASATKYPVGFLQGTLLMAFRASTGLLDVAFAPLTPMTMLSPEPRYMVFPNAEHDEY